VTENRAVVVLAVTARGSTSADACDSVMVVVVAHSIIIDPTVDRSRILCYPTLGKELTRGCLWEGAVLVCACVSIQPTSRHIVIKFHPA
jgi:hypothetical protein